MTLNKYFKEKIHFKNYWFGGWWWGFFLQSVRFSPKEQKVQGEGIFWHIQPPTSQVLRGVQGNRTRRKYRPKRVRNNTS